MQSAVLAMIDSVCMPACLSVGLSQSGIVFVSCQNNSSYDHVVFTGG